MTTPRAKQQQRSKDRRYRASVKAKAIASMGGKCSCCGFDDERALRFHHLKPLSAAQGSGPKARRSK